MAHLRRDRRHGEYRQRAVNNTWLDARTWVFGRPRLHIGVQAPGGVNFLDDFHVFAIEWEPRIVRFFVDQELYRTFTPSRLPAGMKWVFDHPLYIALNVDVGGDWPVPPDSTSVFPEAMLVDYVRVYKAQKAS